MKILASGGGAPALLARVERTRAARAVYRAVLGLVIATGGWCRLHSLDRSLWADEAWVANAVLAPDLGDMLYYDAWLQTSPPLFLVLVRLALAAFGASNAAFHLVPAVAGLLSLAAFAWLATRLLERPYALLAVTLFAFSPALIEYSQTLKPYSSDVLASVLLLLLTLGYMRTRSLGRACFAALALLLLGFLSYTAVVFVPALVLATLVDFSAEGARAATVGDRIRPRPADLVVLASAAAVLSAVNYWFFVSPNHADYLDEFWASGFPSWSTLGDLLLFGKRAGGVLVAPLFMVAPPHPGDLDWLWHVGGAGAGAVVVLGVLALARSSFRRRRARDLGRATLLSCPLVSMVVLNLLGFYPLGDIRTSLFVFPIVLLVLSIGLATLGAAAGRLARRYAATEGIARSVRRAFAHGALLVVLIALGAEAWTAEGSMFAAIDPEEDAQGAIAFLGRRVGPRDTVYVHGSFQEQFKLYSRWVPVRAHRVVGGRIGRPCCARRVPPDRRHADPERLVSGEIRRMDLPRLRGSLWLVFTGRPGTWMWLERDDRVLLHRRLAGVGCERTLTALFVNAHVLRYVCPAASRRPAPRSSPPAPAPAADAAERP